MEEHVPDIFKKGIHVHTSLGVVQARVAHYRNIPNPRAGPSFSFFVPTATHDDLVTSREERHNTTPTGKTGKNKATMVAEPPSSPATWS